MNFYRADLSDLEQELWLRMRNNGKIKWITKDGSKISIKDMSDNHLINTIIYLKTKEARSSETAEILENYDNDLFYDND